MRKNQGQGTWIAAENEKGPVTTPIPLESRQT
jgi:hypothetical protein